MDTEEATYLWHFDKETSLLPTKLKEIDDHLQIIQNQGRQAFLDLKPQNFSRIVHDYSNEQKGFIIPISGEYPTIVEPSFDNKDLQPL